MVSHLSFSPTSAHPQFPQTVIKFHVSVVHAAPSVWNILPSLSTWLARIYTPESSITLSKKPSLSPHLSKECFFCVPTAPTSTLMVADLLILLLAGLLTSLLHWLISSSSKQKHNVPFISVPTLSINVAWLKLNKQHVN